MRPILLALLVAMPSFAQRTADPDPLASSIKVWEVSGDTGHFNRSDLDNIDDEEKLVPGYWPHPYVAGELAVMPGGYAPVAAYGETGLTFEASPGIAQFLGGYDNGRKDDDGDQPNPKGHDRYLRGSFYLRPAPGKRPQWLLGGGYRWSQLSTTNYTKGGSRPFFGFRYDLYRDHSGSDPLGGGPWSMRLGLDYFTAGTDWQNGVHGVELSLTMPRPVEKRHAFFESTFDLTRFHETIAERSQVPGYHQFDGYMSLGMLWRFH